MPDFGNVRREKTRTGANGCGTEEETGCGRDGKILEKEVSQDLGKMFENIRVFLDLAFWA
jgi:hypothetical protein